MNKVIFALFNDVETANQAITQLHTDLSMTSSDISYVYKNRNSDDIVISESDDDVINETPAEGAVSGAATGGIIGATVGLVAVAGLLGPLGPIVVAGPLATFLGLTGAAGAVVGTGIAGAAIGGLVGALTAMGVPEPQARNFEERVDAGEILVSIDTEHVDAVSNILRANGAKEITIVEKAV